MSPKGGAKQALQSLCELIAGDANMIVSTQIKNPDGEAHSFVQNVAARNRAMTNDGRDRAPQGNVVVVAAGQVRPFELVSKVLNLSVAGLILASQYPMLAEIRMRGFVGMLILLVASLAIGWFAGGAGRDNRKTMATHQRTA